MPRPTPILVDEARKALHVSQNGLAKLLGVSRRTGQRWNASSGPWGTHVHNLARVVYSVDPTLAAEIAEVGGTTLAALGVLPPPAPEPPRPPNRIVDAIVCAAAEAMEGSPQSVRPAVLAAFACAEELGLTVSDVLRVLRLPK